MDVCSGKLSAVRGIWQTMHLWSSNAEFQYGETDVHMEQVGIERLRSNHVI
jgi:hypothetical protein